MKSLDRDLLKQLYLENQGKYLKLSLDERISEIFNEMKQSDSDSFDEFKKMLLKETGINEYEYYTKEVDEKLKRYIELNIFPKYRKNDKAHGILHTKEVIRRSFALNDTLKLNLDHNMIYTIAACHDLGKYIDHENHEKIAAEIFVKDEKMKEFFKNEEREEIKEAIQHHRSSASDIPRSIYGKLISSADRNTTIEIVFIRSFFVAQERTPEMEIEDYLNFTFKRLSKRYGEEQPENMFLKDETYQRFLKDMRSLLQDEIKFKDYYCEVNHISSRKNRVCDELGVENFETKIDEDIL